MSNKIRTLTDLLDEMSMEFAWRKKELSGLKGLVATHENNHKCDLLIRAAVTLLYAHWEGFVKNTGTFYLEFVSRQELKHSTLAPSFLATALGKKVRKVAHSSTIQPCLEVVEFFQKESSAKSSLDWKSTIRTRSNLSSEVLREIVTILGLDYSRFSTKEKLLDERLLKNRNNIAHGRHLFVTFAEYMDLHEEVFGMMQDFFNQIENAANTGAYRI